jgi:hypothetical protein
MQTVFEAAGGKLHLYEEEQHDVVRWWFSANLEQPTRFTAAKAPFLSKKEQGIVFVQGHRQRTHFANPRADRNS